MIKQLVKKDENDLILSGEENKIQSKNFTKILNKMIKKLKSKNK